MRIWPQLASLPKACFASSHPEVIEQNQNQEVQAGCGMHICYVMLYVKNHKAT